MANLLQWYGAETGTSWDKVRVYRADTQTGSYVQIGTDLAIATTTYFDEAGTSSHWYKIAFYDSASTVLGPQSAAFYAASTPTLYCNPTELRKFMQYAVTDFPVDEDVTLLLEQAHVAIADDAAGITNSKKLKYLALLLGSSFVSRSLASRALSKGYVSVSLEGGSIMKAHDALLRQAEYYYDLYQNQLAKDTVDYVSTSFMSNGDIDIGTIQEIKDIQNGVSDTLDYQNSYRPSVNNRTRY